MGENLVSVKIRLRRMGAKHQPSYRIVVMPTLKPRDSNYLDQVGFYNPLTDPATVTVDREKVIAWLRKGAEPTEIVTKLLAKFDIDAGTVRRQSGSDLEPMETIAPPPVESEQ